MGILLRYTKGGNPTLEKELKGNKPRKIIIPLFQSSHKPNSSICRKVPIELCWGWKIPL